MFNELLEFLSYPFIRYALIVGILIALCSSVLGVTLVLKRYSFIGDGLSHVAFGALALATVLRINNDMIVVLPVTVLAAVILLCTNQARLKGDSALAMISVGTLAIGYLLLNIFPVSSNVNGDVCGTPCRHSKASFGVDSRGTPSAAAQFQYRRGICGGA